MKNHNLKKYATTFLTMCAVVVGLTMSVNAAVNPSLISKAPNGDNGNGNARLFSVSSDGRYIAFESSATNLVNGITDTNEGRDIFLRDTLNNTTRCLSCVGTATGNGISDNPLMTPDGRFVIFGTKATDLVSGIDINNDTDVIYVDTQTNERKLVSAVPSGVVTGNSYSGIPLNGRAYDMSDDGRYVVFMSNASNLTNITDTNDKTDIFVRDMQLNSTRVITTAIGGSNTGNNFSNDPSISADGNVIAFTSAANNMIALDNNGQLDIYVYYYEEQFMKTASMSVRTDVVGTGDKASYNSVISKDGNRVAYFTSATDLTNIPIPFTDPFVNVVVHDLGLNLNTLATANIGGNASGNNTSGSGNLYRFNISISANGRYVTFETRASNLSLTPSGGSFKVVRRDLTRGITEIVSVKPSGVASEGNSFAGFRGNAMSRDGRFVTFYGTSDLAPDFPGNLGGQQAYVRDMQNGITNALTLRSDGTDLSAFGGFDPRITPNGKAVVFFSGANDLTPTSTNGLENIFKASVPAPQKAVSDFDGDGKTDYAVWRPATGYWYVLPNSGNYLASSIAWGANGDQIVPSDYTGDGKTDVAVFRPSNGFWYIARTTGIPAQNFEAVQFGLATDIPVSGDFDGDGKTDIAVYRPSNGFWYILRSTNRQVQSVQFGNATDKPITGDFDGDGKTDIGVFRSGVFYILESRTGSSRAINWGFASDVPVIGDYDGDGKADVAIFRPSTGGWSVVRSSANSTFTVQFGQNGDAPAPAFNQ